MAGSDDFPREPGPRSADQTTTGELAELFKVLANPNRLRILQVLLAEDELGTSEIAAAIGASPQAVSNQLQRLADQQIVHARRDGSRVRYRIVDPCVPGLIDLGTCLLDQRER